MSATDLAHRLSLALSRETGGERVLWQAAPIARIDPKSFGIYLFAVPWTAFALLWTTMAAAGASAFDGAGVLAWAFPLFGLPFIAVGLAMMAAPFYGYYTAARTLYAVTDRRLVRLQLGRALKVHSVPGERLGEMQRSERPDGSGTLSFAVGVGTDSDGDRVTERFALADIPGVFEAAAQVERMRAALTRVKLSS